MKALLAAVALIPVLASAADIPVVGIGVDGKPRALAIPAQEYARLLGSAARMADASVPDSVPAQGKWKLTMILIGLSLEAEGADGGVADFNPIMARLPVKAGRKRGAGLAGGGEAEGVQDLR